MKTKSISVSLHRKVSDDNYGSFGAEVVLTADLEDGDKVSKCMTKLRDAAEKELDEAVEASKRVAAVKAKKSRD